MIVINKANKKKGEEEKRIITVKTVENLIDHHMASIKDPEYRGLIIVRKKGPLGIMNYVMDTLAFRLQSYHIPFNITMPPTYIRFKNGALIRVVLSQESTWQNNLQGALMDRLAGVQCEKVTMLECDDYTEDELQCIRSRIRWQK